MIAVEKKFLFIHVPKTGGNSIQSMLHPYADDEMIVTSVYQDGVERFNVKNPHYGTTKHAVLAEYKKVMAPELYDSLFKFAVIRNPWDWLISWYFSPRRVMKRGADAWIRDEFIELVRTVPPLRHYIATETLWDKVAQKLAIGRGQTAPLDQEVDFLMRFEHLDDDFKTVCRMIDVPYQPLPVRNKSDRKHYSHYYDESLKEMVRAKFQDEICFGNYTFEDAAGETSAP